MGIIKVYKKENLCRDADTNNIESVEDITVVDEMFFSYIKNRRVIFCRRIHWISSNSAVDTDGIKYTFADSCFMIGPLLGTSSGSIQTDLEKFGVPSVWTSEYYLDKSISIDFGRPIYSLCSGIFITFYDGPVKCHGMITMTILLDDYAVIEIKCPERIYNINTNRIKEYLD